MMGLFKPGKSTNLTNQALAFFLESQFTSTSLNTFVKLHPHKIQEVPIVLAVIKVEDKIVSSITDLAQWFILDFMPSYVSASPHEFCFPKLRVTIIIANSWFGIGYSGSWCAFLVHISPLSIYLSCFTSDHKMHIHMHNILVHPTFKNI